MLHGVPLDGVTLTAISKGAGAGLGFRPDLASVLFRPASCRAFPEVCKMQTKNKRYYTPQFSPMATISVRRLAWSLEKSMPKAVDHIIQLLPSIVDPAKVCLSCQDRSKCASCVWACQSAAAPAAGL